MDTATALTQLRAAVDAAGFLVAPDTIEPYLNESRGRLHGQALAVLRPRCTDEVAAILRICHTHGIGVVAQGGNTGRCGGGVPAAGQIVLALERMHAIRAVDALDDTITVEAGCILAEVQAAAAAVDRLFPLSLGAEGSCRIGGNLASNAGGLNVLRYGMARELCLGLEVVLADGRVWHGLRRLRKDNSGYDLRDLFIGSEGTLGIITAAVLRLLPRPRHTATALLAPSSLTAVLALLARARAAGAGGPHSFELLPRIALQAAAEHVHGCRAPFAELPPWSVLIEFGARGVWIEAELEALLAEAFEAGELDDAVIAQSEAQKAALWRLREGIVEAQKALGASLKHDLAVPVSRVPAFIEQACSALAQQLPGVRPYVFGHVGDGNLHFNLSPPPGMDDASFLAAAAPLTRTLHDLAAAFEGSISAEHGIGLLKTAELARLRPPLELELMRRIKDALDPQGILNPGKVLPPR
ncbi:FAD-binding oxidoreductase [Plasticicumulans acidivorans]|uniref:4-phosphoerythronate dehydrogenase (FAD-dependent) n=1 Tax=Plasticicumulans acidivorans TaxID=886464 RepID=A0A317MTQ6_9GAMM|nr:FAD-binding oxidoreductase [Plasticicumulans acidivorans]PWV60442.1 4-phosphoerythronate dehydrogenase (FAD-dependent) [Plasticicumulans acidivorans]